MWIADTVAGITVAVVAASVLPWAVVVYNRLVRSRNLVQAGLADIDVQLQQRHDLMPQLVEAVRAYPGSAAGRDRPAGTGLESGRA